MIIEKDNRVIRQSGDFEKIKLGIDAEDMAHIFDVLSAPYSNEAQAVIREYSTNAHDEHVKHGITRPFRVTLPTSFEPVFKVRDFAKGLTDEQVTKIYAKYGKSTKRDEADANANNYNGQIGIGAKSGLCYGTKTFSVTSYVQGKQTVYNCYVDGDGNPTYAKLLVMDTDEPDGLEISIPVQLNDMRRFHQEAVRVYNYFEPKPEILNLMSDYKIGRPEALAGLEGKGWRITGGNSYAIMGNVAYPMDKGQINDDNTAVRYLVDAGLEVDFPIGDLAIAISREALKYTPNTKKNFNARLEEVLEEVTKLIEKRFETATNIWEAKILYNKIFNGLGQLSSRLKTMLHGRITWNGIDIDGDTFHWRDSGDSVLITQFEKSYRKTAILSSRRVKQIQAGEEHVVIINDLNTGKGAPSRITELYRNKPFKHAYVITFADTQAEQKFYDEMNFDTVPVKMLTTLDKPAVVRNTNVNAKHQLKCFKWDAAKVKSGVNSEAWTPETIDFENGNGVYVILDRFEARTPSGKTVSPYHFERLLNSLTDLGIVVPEIFAIKPSALEKKTLGKGWKTVWDFAKEELNKKFTTSTFNQDLVDHHHYQNFENRQYEPFRAHIKLLTGKNSLLRDYLEATDKLSKIGQNLASNNQFDLGKITKIYQSFELNFNQAVKPSYNLVDMRDAIEKRYPLISSFSSWEMNRRHEALIHYFNLIDETP